MIFQGNITIIAVLIFSVAFPIGLLIWWKRKTGEKLRPFLVGAICFGLFAMILERILHQVCLINENPISHTILASPVLYTIYAAFAAGIFEETGRLFGYKILLGKYHNNSCAVAYGIGHGGCEVLILLGINYLALLLAQLGVNLGGEAVNAHLIATANAISFAPACLGMLERVFAMMTHVGLSMLAFVAAREKGLFWLYLVAILLHALTNVPAALYQYQILTSLFVLEVATFMISAFCLVLGIRTLRKYGNRRYMENESQRKQSR